MADIKAARLPANFAFARQWLAPGLVLIYQILSILALVAIPIYALNWFNTPFLGAFVEHTLFLSASQPSLPESWPLSSKVAQFGYQLTALDGQPVTRVSELDDLLAGYSIGDLATVTLKTPLGDQQDIPVSLIEFPRADQIAYFFIPYLIGLVYMGTSIWIFSLRRRDPAGRSFAVFTASVAVAVAGQFDMSTTNHLTYLWTVSIGLMSGSLISLAMLFPQEQPLANRFPFLRWIGYAISLGLIVYTLPAIYNLTRPLAYVWGWRLEYIFGAISILIFICLTVLNYLKTSFPVIKEQSRLILIGSVISFGPLGAWFLITSLFPQVRYTPYLILPVIIFPIVVGYTVLRYRLT